MPPHPSFKINFSNNTYLSVEKTGKYRLEKLILHNPSIYARNIKEIGVSVKFENFDDSGDAYIRFNGPDGTKITEGKKYYLSDLSRSGNIVEAGGTKEIRIYVEEGFDESVKLVAQRNDEEVSSIKVTLSNDGE